MLDLMKQETERIDSHFLEPARSDGNSLAEILCQKNSDGKSQLLKKPSGLIIVVFGIENKKFQFPNAFHQGFLKEK